MYNNLEYNENAKEMLNQLPKGAFLSVRDGDRINTMTIGWGAVGFMWQRPVMIVAVRYSRYTYGLIEDAQEFSVSVPLDNEMKKSLAIAGTNSGRDMDKFKFLQLTAQDGKSIKSPVIGNCGLVYECRVVYHQPMEPKMLDTNIKEKFYNDDDYHVMYFGEILACYKNKYFDKD